MTGAYEPYLDKMGRRQHSVYSTKSHLHIGFDNLVPFIVREDWGATPPRQSTGYLCRPVTHARITATRTDSCKSREECAKVLQNLQCHYMTNGLCDIPYSFMIGENLTVYEGRGFLWNPLFKEDYGDLDGKVLDIALIGTFQHEDPPPSMMALAIDLINACIMRRLLIAKFDLISFPEDREPKLEINL